MKAAAVSDRRRLTPSRRLEMQAGHQFVFFPCTLLHVFFLLCTYSHGCATVCFLGCRSSWHTDAKHNTGLATSPNKERQSFTATLMPASKLLVLLIPELLLLLPVPLPVPLLLLLLLP